MAGIFFSQFFIFRQIFNSVQITKVSNNFFFKNRPIGFMLILNKKLETIFEKK